MQKWFSKSKLQCKSHSNGKKNLIEMQETWVKFLDGEDSLEKGMPPTPVFLPGEFPGQRGPGGLQSMGSQRIRHD